MNLILRYILKVYDTIAIWLLRYRNYKDFDRGLNIIPI